MSTTRQLKFLLAIAPLFILNALSLADDDALADLQSIKAQEVMDYVSQNDDVVILDVRTPMEYGISHVPGAVNINVQDESFEDLVGQLDSDKTFIVYCTKNPAGGRSMTALAKMKALGFKELVSLEGGHVAWSEADLPMSGKDNP